MTLAQAEQLLGAKLPEPQAWFLRALEAQVRAKGTAWVTRHRLLLQAQAEWISAQ